MSSHISNVGRFIEGMEIKMRNSLQDVYFSSSSPSFSLLLPLLESGAHSAWLVETKDVVSSLRSTAGFAEGKKRNALQGELVGLLRGKAAASAA